MKTKISKRAWSLLLALALVVTAVFGNVTTAKAATYTDYYATESVETGVAGVEQKFSFTHSKSGDLYMDVYFAAPIDMTLSLYNSTGALVSDANNPMSVSASDPNWVSYQGMYIYQDAWKDMPAGDYAYGVTLSADAQFMLNIYTPVAEPKISQKEATITVGFTKKLSVTDGTVKSWTSSKKEVATVDKKGKVTAKKSGKTTITATLTDGTKLKCKVTVQTNKYSATKITSSDVAYNEYGAKAYSASFDKNGNLVIKISIVNGGYGKITKIPNFKVTVKNQNGKTVGTFKKSSYSVSVPSYSQKTYTVTIKKSSKLTASKVDLRNSTISVSGGAATGYY